MRIILADDHELVRAGIKPFLADLAEPMDVVECGDLPSALQAADPESVDLVILDLSMPGMNGEEGLHTALATFAGRPVVVLSASTQVGDILTAARAGAAGYLPKSMSGPAMTTALRLILLGERFFPACVLQGMTPPPSSGDSDGQLPPVIAPRRRNPLDLLSAREREILRLMIEGGTNKEIARRLTVQEITVKVHLRNIYRKLGAANRAQAVRIALENGWRA
ncbi:response regulator transcription factor [Caenispirillum bisanense]|uniref:response regulator transcription factor n=1 Tax=Caenispirillum bisanense TaxID=414052 RepID=UPI0031E01F75